MGKSREILTGTVGSDAEPWDFRGAIVLVARYGIVNVYPVPWIVSLGNLIGAPSGMGAGVQIWHYGIRF